MKLEPVPRRPGLFRDPETNQNFNVRGFAPAHVIWTFREGPTRPSVRLATSAPGQEWPFVLSSVSAPLIGNGEGYFHLKEAAAPLVGVQQHKLLNPVLVKDFEMLREAELRGVLALDDEEIIIGFGAMRFPA